MLIDVGAVVAKKYELVRLLGRGSMGEVWVAHHTTLGEKLALKLLTQGPSGSDEVEDARQAAARFRFEAQVAAKLSRKTRHIVRVTDHGEEDGLAYLVMELLDGQTLETALTRTPTLPLGSVVKVVQQVSRALVQAHAEGVLHRDLKPANVFLSTDEEGALLVKLLDFGIARAIHAHRVPKSFTTHKGVVFGTPAYMSPEQARASSKLDHRCDLWALATIAYETLTGDLPVAGADAEELLRNLCAGRMVPIRVRNPRLPHALGTFFDKAFAERVDDRYSSAADMAHDFEVASGASSSGTAAMTPSLGIPGARRASLRAAASDPGPHEVPATHASGPHRRLRTRLAMAAGGALVLGLTVGGAVWRAHLEPRAPAAIAATAVPAPHSMPGPPSMPVAVQSPLPAPSASAPSAPEVVARPQHPPPAPTLAPRPTSTFMPTVRLAPAPAPVPLPVHATVVSPPASAAPRPVQPPKDKSDVL